jgi:hypothetical protein
MDGLQQSCCIQHKHQDDNAFLMQEHSLLDDELIKQALPSNEFHF